MPSSRCYGVCLVEPRVASGFARHQDFPVADGADKGDPHRGSQQGQCLGMSFVHLAGVL